MAAEVNESGAFTHGASVGQPLSYCQQERNRPGFYPAFTLPGA